MWTSHYPHGYLKNCEREMAIRDAIKAARKYYEQGQEVDAADREPRKCRLFKLMITGHSFPETAATIRNISEHGLGGKTKAPLQVGETVCLKVEGKGDQLARVCWVNGENFGLYVIERIDLREFNFVNDGWDEKVVKPLGPSHVFDRFIPAVSTKRPGLGVFSK